MKNIQIDSAVKMPEKRQSFPFAKLKVGQSFIYGKYSRELHMKCGAHIFYYANSLKKRFICRKDDDGQLRVWRNK